MCEEDFGRDTATPAPAPGAAAGMVKVNIVNFIWIKYN